MAALIPLAIVFLGIGAAILLFTSFWAPISRRIEGVGAGFTVDMEITRMSMKPQVFAFIVVGLGLGLWVLALVLLSPPLIVGILLFVLCIGGSLLGARMYIRRRKNGLLARFQDQMEGALRTLAGGVRVGLGVRQAIVMVGEQSREPTRYEFARVVSLTNVGMSLFDAFDDLALRMANPETAMLARILRVQARTGGDLASVLDNLADTIRDRGRLKRKISSITAQGRATGWLLGFIPIGVGLFLFVAEPQLRDVTLHTVVGQFFLSASLGLDGLAIFALMRITKLDG